MPSRTFFLSRLLGPGNKIRDDNLSDETRSAVQTVTSGGGSLGLDSTDITNLISADYIQARQSDIYRDSAFVTGIVDNVYIQARDRVRDSGFITDIIDGTYVNSLVQGVDSAAVSSIIDSDYVSARAGSSGGAGASMSVSDTAPSNPNDGDLWFNSSKLKTYVYYNDGDTSQWVVANSTGPAGASGSDGSSVVSYATASSFPSSGNTTGDFAFAEDTKALYLWDGSEWDQVYSGPNDGPMWTTEPTTSLNLYTGDSASTITIAAEDPEGFPITYDVSVNPSNQAQATIVNNNDGTFAFTPTSNTANVGEFTARFTASDGLNVISKYSDIAVLNPPPQMANLIGWYDLRNSTSYPGTGTTLYDLTSNNNDATIINPGSSSYLDGTAIGNTSAYNLSLTSTIVFPAGIYNNVNTVMVIMSYPSDDGNLVLFAPAAGSNYLGCLSESSTNSIQAGYSSTAHYVNGTAASNRNQATLAMDTNLFNSYTITGVTGAETHYMILNGYQGSGYNDTFQVQGVLVWDVALTTTEIEEAHAMFSSMATWAG